MNHHSTFEDWLRQNFSHNELADLCHHGAVNGFHGLIYYTETVKLYDQFHKEIWQLIAEDAEQCDDSCLLFLATMNGEKAVDSDVTFKNHLVWYAAERLAYAITQGCYIRERLNT